MKNWPENSKHHTPLYEALQAEYPVLSETPGTGETIETEDDYLEGDIY